MLVSNFIELFLDSAPWLLLGLVLAGMLKMFVPMAWMHKQLGGSGVKTTVKAALLGAPLPLCSCGVIPAAVGLRRSGASKAATTSFMVSTPETGVDSVTVSYVLLGPFMAIVRPIAAVVSAIVAGLLVGSDGDEAEANQKKTPQDKVTANSDSSMSCCSQNVSKAVPAQPAEPSAPQSTCCASKKSELTPASNTMTAAPTLTPVKIRPVAVEQSAVMASRALSLEPKQAPNEANSSCCSSKVEAVAPAQSKSCCATKTEANKAPDAESCCTSTKDVADELKQETIVHRLGQGLKYAATDLVRDTTIWLLIGLFFAALVQTYVPGDFLAKWGDGLLAMLVMVLVSIPMYICATASTPIAAGLLLAGVSPGAVLVFMMAGPATNIATLGVVTKELGKRALLGYLGGVLGVALLAGGLVNYLVANFGFEVMPQIGEHHQLLPQSVVIVSGIVLAVLMARVLFEKLPKHWWRRDCCS